MWLTGPTENYPSERQAAALRSVDGTTRAAKAASLERGVQAAFAIPTADRAAAMLKVGPPLLLCYCSSREPDVPPTHVFPMTTFLIRPVLCKPALLSVLLTACILHPCIVATLDCLMPFSRLCKP